MKKIDDWQRKAIFKLCRELKYDDDTRHIVINSITNGRTDSLAVHATDKNDITFYEANLLIDVLNEKLPKPMEQASVIEQPVEKELQKQIYNYCYRMQWTQAANPKLIDFKRLQSWQQVYCAVKKNVLKCTVDELQKIIAQMSIMVRNHETALKQC